MTGPYPTDQAVPQDQCIVCRNITPYAGMPILLCLEHVDKVNRTVAEVKRQLREGIANG